MDTDDNKGKCPFCGANYKWQNAYDGPVYGCWSTFKADGTLLQRHQHCFQKQMDRQEKEIAALQERLGLWRKLWQARISEGYSLNLGEIIITHRLREVGEISDG